MSYEIEKRSLEPVPFLYMEKTVKPEEIADALGAMFGAVFQYATSRGVPFAGPPTARYTGMEGGTMTIEAGLPIAGEAEGEGEIRCGALQGGPTATTVHKGPYDSLGEAHRAVEAWLAANGESPGGPPWESYVNDPSEVTDPAEWLTEVNWPVAQG